MRGHYNLTTCHPSQPSLPDHPFLVLGLVVLDCLRLVSVLGTCLVSILGICLWLPRVRRGRALLSASGIRLGDYDAISITRSRNERYKTTILAATTLAFGVVGELEGQLLRAFVRRILGDMSQCKDK
jgi:hypothetical protein